MPTNDNHQVHVTNVTAATREGPERQLVGDTLQATIVTTKAVAVPVRGFLDAVTRLRQAAAGTDPDLVYTACFEAANWLSSLESQTTIKSDADVQAVGFARDRAHHQWGSVIDHDEHGWIWRPAASLPAADNPRLRSNTKKPIYVDRIEGKPLLDVFDRLEPLVSKLV